MKEGKESLKEGDKTRIKEEWIKREVTKIKD